MPSHPLEKVVEWWEGAYHSEDNQDESDDKHGSEPHLFMSPELVIDQPGNEPDHYGQRRYAGQRPGGPVKLKHIRKGCECSGQDSKQAKSKAANTSRQHSGGSRTIGKWSHSWLYKRGLDLPPRPRSQVCHDVYSPFLVNRKHFGHQGSQ